MKIQKETFKRSEGTKVNQFMALSFSLRLCIISFLTANGAEFYAEFAEEIKELTQSCAEKAQRTTEI